MKRPAVHQRRARVLACVGYEPRTVRDIARFALVPERLTLVVLRHLERDGLVERDGSTGNWLVKGPRL